MNPVNLYERSVDRLIVDELLPAFPAVLVVGPRGCGKSTSALQLADTVLDLSLPGVRAAVQQDPDGVLATAQGTVLVDEWQEAPEILGAIKRIVDRDTSNRPGRFLVTGSVRAAYQAATWPGTGRLIRVRMFGLTQAELERTSTYNPIDAFFAPSTPSFSPSGLTRSDYAERITAGRFPAVTRLTGRNRARWYRAYVEQLIERDAEQIADRSTRPAKLRSVFAATIARTGQELNKSHTAQDANVDFRSADYYIELLENLSIIFRIPAWHTNRVKRLTKAPKVHAVDPGMAAHTLGFKGQTLDSSPFVVGQLFETFVAAELATLIETAGEETTMSHLRTRDGVEVDLVLQQYQRIVGIEIKSATSVNRSDARGLLWLRDKLGDDFHYGAVLYSGTLPFQIDDRIWALPISALWHPPLPGD